jgi:hypothetical protein
MAPLQLLAVEPTEGEEVFVKEIVPFGIVLELLEPSDRAVTGEFEVEFALIFAAWGRVLDEVFLEVDTAEEMDIVEFLGGLFGVEGLASVDDAELDSDDLDKLDEVDELSVVEFVKEFVEFALSLR